MGRKKKNEGDNPFKIGTIDRNGFTSTSLMVSQLVERIKDLPVSTTKCVIIPTTVASDKKAMGSLITGARRILKRDRTIPKSFTITYKLLKDNGKFSGAAVWRMA
jgi:hypothetical protein